MRRDVDKDVSVASTQLPNVIDATAQGVTVDLAGYRSALFVAHIGTITDGTFAFDPEESADGQSWGNIAAGDLSGTFVNATSSADETVQEVAYLGTKRYVRCNLTVTGSPETGGAVSVVVVRGAPRKAPV